MSDGFKGLSGKDIISVLDLSKEDFENIFKLADEYRVNGYRDVLRGRVLSVAFFEPSTRTRLSFESAMHRLGGSVIGFSSEEATSVAKGEKFIDTVRMLDSYSDVIVIRHKFEGAAKLAAEVAEHPVINAGDGRNEHPTQAMIDIYTILKLKSNVSNLIIGVMGDLKYARVVNSLLYAFTIFKPKKVYLISHPLLKLRDEAKKFIASQGLNFEEVSDINLVLNELDVLYVTRVQKERFPDPIEYEKVKNAYKLTADVLRKCKEDLIILHPLPRVDELERSVDSTKHAAYFKQASLGVPLRAALLTLILGGY
ncbi:MAG: aspartate carbamoyltransferase [Sulfolobales archaeon]|nr:aspartate carbamoyltransferase [Sulfolobales archaeon]MCX8186077.1 aspartate carbamoyltransferase [Sulfolobales archaeon]MDW7969372.1 aspartate carbamoyltransferase [Sulfolobales archaeon]